jgi:hypothetical protein
MCVYYLLVLSLDDMCIIDNDVQHVDYHNSTEWMQPSTSRNEQGFEGDTPQTDRQAGRQAGRSRRLGLQHLQQRLHSWAFFCSPCFFFFFFFLLYHVPTFLVSQLQRRDMTMTCVILTGKRWRGHGSWENTHQNRQHPETRRIRIGQWCSLWTE